MEHRRFIRLAPLLGLVLVLAACTSGGDDETTTSAAGAETTTTAGGVAGDSVLETVIANDVVRCGTRGDLPGFASLTPEGEHEGFDSDFCRVIAAAVL
ncbi:MAG: amino acid ABC transporter substrate-binding protein, partial [Actinobacteria bacterium]